MKCIVKDCINQTHEGRFVGELCAPCHKFVTTGNGVHSQAYRNAQRTWVGLTDEECLEASLTAAQTLVTPITLSGVQIHVARVIESKLKEKNT